MKSRLLVVALVVMAGVMLTTRAMWGVERSIGGPAEAAMSTVQDDGFESLIKKSGDRYNKGGWNHYGPGYLVLDADTGVLETHGGMGLFWFAEKKFGDFVLELEFKTSKLDSNSGVFIRMPNVPTSDDYIYDTFEIQIYDSGEGVHQTGAVYDAEASTRMAARPTGEWNSYRITCLGKNITVELNGEVVVDAWETEPRGKVRSVASRGYIGLQNHDHDSSVWFRNIRVKELE